MREKRSKIRIILEPQKGFKKFFQDNTGDSLCLKLGFYLYASALKKSERATYDPNLRFVLAC